MSDVMQPVTRNRRGVATALVAGTSTAAIVAAVIVAGSLLPHPDGTKTLDTRVASVPAGETTAVCPSPVKLLQGSSVGTDAQFSPDSSTAKNTVSALVPSDTSGAIPASNLATINGTTLAEIAKAPASGAGSNTPALKAAVVSSKTVDAAAVLSADPLKGNSSLASAVFTYTASDGDLKGIASAPCVSPSNDQWVMGASTTVGRTSVLTLSNPSKTPATVNLEMFGAKGAIQAAGSRGLLVSPGKSRSIVLAGLVPEQAALAVHVRSMGGAVAASIQQSTLRGLTAGGVEVLSATAAPGTSAVLTSVVIQDPTATATVRRANGFGDAGPVLQLLVPGAADAVAQVKLFGANGQQALDGGGVITAKAGQVTEVPLDGVPAGIYTVSVTSDVSLAAAARITRGSKPTDALDFAFSGASTQLSDQQLVTVPRSSSTGNSKLNFGVPQGRAQISYTAITADGALHKAQSISVAGGTSATVDIPAQLSGTAVVGYILSASGDQAYGSLLQSDSASNGLSVVPILPGVKGQQSLPVTLNY
ncbi:DUF5719 family protein [Pseudarthrobacter sp. J1738]|uniref:DUF5719 family protein n=1 Tax=unclassified Pseudarthrobacter TaxID=2647000 RepID=UPI003D2895B2